MQTKNSVIDVWKVSLGKTHCYVDNEQDALDSSNEECIITKMKMNQEDFEKLPEFNGF